MLKARLGVQAHAEISAARPAKISAARKFKAMEFKMRADGFANFTAGSAFAYCKTTHATFGRTWLLSARKRTIGFGTVETSFDSLADTAA